MNPPLLIKGTQLDFELCNLLGEGSADFVVICANGEQVPFLGTPFDSPGTRATYEKLVASLNDRSAKSQWRELFRNWREQFLKHYKLPAETTSFDFHPDFSFAISRVCAGYSEHLPAAVGLLEKLGPRIGGWIVSYGDGRAVVEIIDSRGAIVRETGETLARVIATAVHRLLTFAAETSVHARDANDQ